MVLADLLLDSSELVDCVAFLRGSMFELEFCLRPQAWLQQVDVKRLLGLHAVFGTRKESYMSEYVSIWVLLPWQ